MYTGAYVEETGVFFADYIQLYQEARQSLLARRGSEANKYGNHPESVVVTLELSLEKACKHRLLATDLLHFCAFLQSDAMPKEVLQQADGLTLDKLSFNEVTAALQRYSLIRRNNQDKTFSMHRLVQAVIIDNMPPDLRKQWQARVIQTLNETFPEVEFKEWRQCERLLPHVLACATWKESELIPMLDASQLFLKAGIYLRQQGQYVEAEALLVRTLSIQERLGTERPDTARSLRNLAILYRKQGKYKGAEPLYQRALSIYEQHLGAEHPDIADTLSNLAILCWQQGKYEQAEPLHQRALAIRERHLGAEHPDTASSLHNLAIVYRDRGKYEDAEALYQRALSIHEKHLGAEHPNTASSLHNLAELHRRQGKYEQAETLYQRALSIQEQRLGATHPHTQETRKDYAAFLRSIGRNAEAAAIELGQELDSDVVPPED